MSSLAEDTTRVYRRKYDTRHPVRNYPTPNALADDDLIDDQAREDENFNAGIRVAAHLIRTDGDHAAANRILALMRIIPL